MNQRQICWADTFPTHHVIHYSPVLKPQSFQKIKKISRLKYKLDLLSLEGITNTIGSSKQKHSGSELQTVIETLNDTDWKGPLEVRSEMPFLVL